MSRRQTATLANLLATALVVPGVVAPVACADSSVSADDIIAVVSDHVAQVTDSRLGQGAAVQVQVLGVPGAPFRFLRVDNPADIKLEANSHLSENFTNRTIVSVRMTTPDGLARQVGVPVKLDVTRPVWVVKRPMTAGEVVNKSALALESREIGQLAPYVLGSDDDLSDFQSRVCLKPGEILDSRKLVHPPAVRRNDDVRITLITGQQGMAITLVGTALEDGRIGQTIRVRNPVNKQKVYAATVIDKKRVKVEL
jgi:flagella basal body P-ring formation protein FlgA